MATLLETSTTTAGVYVTPDSRYLNSSVYYYGDEKKIVFETYKKKEIIPTSDDKYWIIDRGHEYRPDKLAYERYGRQGLWWKILEANNMKDIMDFKAGVQIIIPGDSA